MATRIFRKESPRFLFKFSLRKVTLTEQDRGVGKPAKRSCGMGNKRKTSCNIAESAKSCQKKYDRGVFKITQTGIFSKKMCKFAANIPINILTG